MTLTGFVSSIRMAGKQLCFVNLLNPELRNSVQLKIDIPSQSNDSDSTVPTKPAPHTLLNDLRPHTPVEVTGVLVPRPGNKGVVNVHDKYVGQVLHTFDKELDVKELRLLGSFPPSLSATAVDIFPPEQRHLQFRVDYKLRHNIRCRSFAQANVSKWLYSRGFDQIETPMLFKSTPEGAREFLVPTRQKGMAYALPQSPQQYKQLLMASGVHRYFQFARCFRDEDLRTDRQPEFTQIDLEMSFADPEHVIGLLEPLFLHGLFQPFRIPFPKPRKLPFLDELAYPSGFPRITYDQAMAFYGSDKPALQFPGTLHRIDDWAPEGLVRMLTSLSDPIVEAFVLRGEDATVSRDFVQSFMDSPTAQEYAKNPDGMPGIAVFDPTKPLNGLAAFGHESSAKAEETFELQPGDVLIVQCRSKDRPLGGSTPLGNMRVDVSRAAQEAGLLDVSDELLPLWVTDFPLFTPLEADDIGATSASGLCSTHHPFTAPKPSLENISKLSTAPLEVVGDHFDLVINGVEVGGGSRRIHKAPLQECIFRDILKLRAERVEDFRHLLNALKDGCPPHTGFAIGFDRLMTLLMKTPTVREVIAFPKTGSGEDRFVGAPARMTDEQLRTYHLSLAGEQSGPESNEVTASPDEVAPKISVKA